MRVGHSSGLENVVGDESLPRLAGNFLHQPARHDVEDVVVGELLPETGGRPEVAQGVHDIVTASVGIRNDQQVAFSQAQSAAVREQVTYRHVGGDIGIVHLKSGKPVGDVIAPGQLLAIDQDCQSGRGEGLGFRPDGKSGVFVHDAGTGQAAHAVALRQGRAAAFHDRQRQARRAERLHRLRNIGVDVGRRCGVSSVQKRRRCAEHRGGGG